MQLKGSACVWQRTWLNSSPAEICVQFPPISDVILSHIYKLSREGWKWRSRWTKISDNWFTVVECLESRGLLLLLVSRDFTVQTVKTINRPDCPPPPPWKLKKIVPLIVITHKKSWPWFTFYKKINIYKRMHSVWDDFRLTTNNCLKINNMCQVSVANFSASFRWLKAMYCWVWTRQPHISRRKMMRRAC